MLEATNSLGSISEINEALRAQNIGVRVRQHRFSRLLLRATLPAKSGSPHDPPTRQDVSTGLRDNPIDRREIYLRAVKMAFDVSTGRFNWKEWERPKASPKESAAIVIQRFANHYQKIAERDGRMRWRVTWEKDYLAPYAKLTADHPLSVAEMQRIVNEYSINSRPRQRYARAYTTLCEFVGIKATFDSGKYNRTKARAIVIPSDQEILLGYEKIAEPWRWSYGVMATYGLRPSEVPEVVGFDGLRLILADGKTGGRSVLPFPELWATRWHLTQAFYPLQQTQRSSMEKRLVAMSRAFTKQVGFTPKALRKACAIRMMINGVPDTIAGQMLGHDPSTLQSHYQSYITEQGVDAAWLRWNSGYEDRTSGAELS